MDDIEFFKSLGEAEIRRRVNTGQLPVEYDQGKRARAWLAQLDLTREVELENAKLSALQSIPRIAQKKWYERLPFQLLLGTVSSLFAWVILRYFGLA